MAMLVVSTQVYENYAAHGGFNGEYYWKAKGGSEYKVTNVPLNIDFEEVISMLNVERKNDYVEETIIGWSVENDDYLSWFEKSQLEYDGEIVFKEPEIDYNDLIGEYA
jgi:hypothetical protein